MFSGHSSPLLHLCHALGTSRPSILPLAYWHMNFSLINECGTCENIIKVILSFEVALVSSPILYLLTKKTSIRKKCLQSIGTLSWTLDRDHSNKK